MQRMVKPVVLLAVAALAGCTHKSDTRADVPVSAPVPGAATVAAHAPDSSVDAAAVARSIRLCRTQFADLQQQLGQPTRDGLMHKQHIVSWIVQWEAPTRELAVLLNAQNTVIDIYWNAASDTPWTPTDQCLAP